MRAFAFACVVALLLSVTTVLHQSSGTGVNGASAFPPKAAHEAGPFRPGRPAPVPHPTPTAASRSAQRQPLLDWRALATCESRGNPRAVSRTGRYRGLYQFSLASWEWVGGTGDPIHASPAEQTRRARLLFQRIGAAAWPVCGKHLRSRS